MARDLAALIELGRSFHQERTFHLKVCESDFVPLWDETIKQRSHVEHKLLEGTYTGNKGFKIVHLGIQQLVAGTVPFKGDIRTFSTPNRYILVP